MAWLRPPLNALLLAAVQGEVLEECKMMVPHTQKRLAEAHEELSKLVDEAKADLAEAEEFKAAVQMLADVPVAAE